MVGQDSMKQARLKLSKLPKLFKMMGVFVHPPSQTLRNTDEQLFK